MTNPGVSHILLLSLNLWYHYVSHGPRLIRHRPYTHFRAVYLSLCLIQRHLIIAAFQETSRNYAGIAGITHLKDTVLKPGVEELEGHDRVGGYEVGIVFPPASVGVDPGAVGPLEVDQAHGQGMAPVDPAAVL